MADYHFSLKFYLGLVFIALSLIIGKITTLIFFFQWNDAQLRWLSLIVYILSWPLLIIGVWWVGREYSSTIKKYLSCQFYHQSLKEKTQQAYQKTKEKTRQFRSHVQERFRPRDSP